MAKNAVMLLERDAEQFAGGLRALKLPDLEILVPQSEDEIRRDIGRVNILFAIPLMAKGYINDAKSLRWVQSTYAGVDALNDTSLRTDYLLTNVRDVYGPAIAEYVFGYTLLLRKEILEDLQYQKQKEWRQRSLDTLDGQTMVVLGTGSIGKEIARIAKAFGMRTVGYRTAKEPVEHFDEIYAGNELSAALALGDYVVNVLPNTADTAGIINAKSIGAMKDGVVFFNVGRGSAVDEAALQAAVVSGKVSRAVLDVFNTEPLPPESPLWSTEGVFVTPHLSGYLKRADAIVEIFADNYRRFMAGEPLRYPVDLSKGY